MILRRTDRAGAGVLAGKLRTTLLQQPAVVGAGESIPIRVCIGIASYPDDAATAGELAQLADGALYRAKAAGRDRVEFSGAVRAQPA